MNLLVRDAEPPRERRLRQAELEPARADPPSDGDVVGIAALSTTHAACPVVAIGGITPENAADVRNAGAYGVAVIRAILQESDPATATRRLLKRGEMRGASERRRRRTGSTPHD